MATKPETTLYTAINKSLPRELHREKMNNPYRGGTPDFFYSGNKADKWVEYKWLPRTPRSSFVPALSSLQIKWLRERHGEGRNVAVIVGSPTGVMILKALEWESPVVPDFSLSRPQAADWIMKETQYGKEDAVISKRSSGDDAHV